MRADASRPAAVTRLACATRAPFAAPWRLDWHRAGRHRRDRSQALARRTTRQAAAGIEPAAAWQSLRGESLARFNITGCCRQPRRSLAKARSLPGLTATPVMSCAAAAPAARPAGYGSPRSKTAGMCGHGWRHRRKGPWSGAASGAVMGWAPPGHPSAPKGLPEQPPPTANSPTRRLCGASHRAGSHRIGQRTKV